MGQQQSGATKGRVSIETFPARYRGRIAAEPSRPFRMATAGPRIGVVGERQAETAEEHGHAPR